MEGECQQDNTNTAPSDIKPISECMSAAAKRILSHPVDPDAERKLLDGEKNRERRRREGMLADLAKQAGGRYSSCTFQNFRTDGQYQGQIAEMVKEYACDLPARIEAGEQLVLYGDVGTGKDHLAWCVAATAIVRHGWHVHWIKGIDWYGDLRDAIGDGRNESSLIEVIGSPTICVLSDPLPPVGSLTQYQAAMLYRGVDRRYSGGKLTIVTLNVSSDEEADERLGAPVWDRICHGAWKLACRWPSYRQPVKDIRPPSHKPRP